MNIFDPHISGSLSVSGSGVISGDLTVLGTINATISGTTSNALTASEAPRYTLTSSFETFTGSYTTGSFTGSFKGDGSNLYNIPASGVTGLNLTQIADGSVTASVSNANGFRVNSNTEITGALVISGSISLNGVPVGTGKLDETTFNTYTSSVDDYIDDTQALIDTLATTGSNLFKGTQTHSGSIVPSVDNTYDLGSPDYQWRDVYISSGSLYIDGSKVLSSTAQELTITTDDGQSIKILEGTTDSIVLQVADGDIELKSSADGDILLDPTNGKIMLKGPVEILNGQKIQSSVNGTPVVFANDIVVSGSIELTGTIDGIDLSSLSSSLNTRIGSIESTTLLLNEFTSSTIGRLNSLESETSSLSSSIGSVSSSITNTTNNLSSSIGVFSSSFTSTITNLSSSMITLSSSFTDTDISHNNRLNTIESRYTTTGSNVFIGNQTITGSLYVSQNLIVQGESSLENVTASAVSIGTNTVILNSNTPSVRYAGIAVYDSGSTNVTASLLYDSLTNQWKFKHLDTGTNDASVLLYGPLGNDIDNTPTLTSNFLTKVEDNDHGHHLTTSSVFDNGSKISLKNNTEVTGSLIVTGTLISQGTTLISGSSQVSFNTISDKPSGIISGSSQVVSSLPNGTVSGSSQVSFNTISDKPTLVSGSSQVSFNSISDKPTLVSGSSQISYPSLSNIPGGIVSGSSQIDLTATTNYSSGIKTRLNAEGVVSGSSQVTGIGNSQLTNSSFHVGTTSISLGRASTSQTLTGVSIDGNSATVTNGVYTNTNQTITGVKTFQEQGDDIAVILDSTNVTHATRFRYRKNGTDYWSLDARGSGESDALNLYRFYSGNWYSVVSWNHSNGAATFTGAISASNLSGTNTGDQTNITGNAGTVTNGVYTTGDQTISGVKTLSSGAVIGNMNISKSPYTDTIENKTSAGVVWLNYSHAGNVGLAYGGGKVGVGTLDTPTGKLHVVLPTYTNEDTDAQQAIFGATNGYGVRIGYTETGNYGVINSLKPGVAWGNLILQRGGGNVGINTSSLSSKFTVYKASQSNTVSIANSAAYIYGADIGLAIGQDSGAAGYGTWLQSMQTGGNSFPMTINPNGGNVIVGSLTTSSYKFSVFGGQYGTYLRGGDLGTGSDILRLVDSAGSTKYLARGDGKHYFEGDVVINGGDFKFNPGTGDLGSRYFYVNKGASNDGGILMLRDNSLDWQIINATGSGNLSFYSYGTGGFPMVITRSSGLVTVNNGITSNGIGIFNSTNDTQISLRSADAWAGIEFDDSGSPDYIWYNGGNQTFSIGGGGGNVSGKKLHVHGGMTIGSSYTATSNPTNGLNVQGDTTIGGTLTENSSLRYKKDIVTIENGLDKVLRMRGVTYLKKENNIKEVGVIAEEIGEILPDLVKYNTEGQIDSVSYGRITAVLIEAIKELKQEINDLKNNG
jgi:hypothetical protein